MAVALVRNHGNASNKAAGTTLAMTFTFSSVAGNVLVATVVFDNAATASKPIVSSISKGAGETANWVFLGAARSTSTTAGAFASGEVWAIRTTVAWTLPTITLTIDTSTVMKSIAFTEFSGVEAIQRSTAGTAYSTTTTAASAATTGTTPVIGDLAVGLIFQSNVASGTSLSDTDTVGGSWVQTAFAGSTGSGAATNNSGSIFYKILTAASHQTLNASTALTAGNGSIVAVLQAIPVAAITQASYRFYDDGTEAGSVARAAQDTATSADLTNGDGEGLIRVRLQSTNTGDQAATDDYQLQYEKNASGTWINVPDTTIASWNSASLTEGQATTNRLGAGTGSFVAGKVSEDGLLDDLLITANNYTELLYSVLFKAAPFVSGDTVRFRVVRNGSTAGITYTQTPTVNITRTLPAVTQSSYRFYADGTESGSVALAAQDTSYSPNISGGDVNLLLRARLQSTNVAPIPVTDDWQLQYGKNLSGTYISEPGSTGNNVDTPHRSAFDLATSRSLLVIAYIAADDWTPTSQNIYTSIWGLNAADGMFRCGLASSGTLSMSLSVGGLGGTGATTTVLQSLSAVPDGSGQWVWCMWQADDGTTDFKYSTDPLSTPLGSIVWTNVQTNRASSVTGILTTSTAPLRIGGYDTNGNLLPFAGKVYRSWVGTGAATGIGSFASATELADFNADKWIGGPTLVSGAANDVWTINGTASAVQPGWLSVGVGSEALLDSYGQINVDSGMGLGGGASLSAMGQSFLGDGQKLARVGFFINSQGAPTGSLTAQLFAHFDTFGSASSTPTGAALATSTAVSATVLTGTGAWVYFTFDQTFTVASGTPYFLSLGYSLFGDATNFVQAGYDNSTATHPGALAQLAFGSWASITGADAAFEVYTAPASEVIPFDSVNLTDGQATTNRLGAGSGSFTAGKVSEDALVDNLGWAGNNYTEVLYALTLRSSVLTNGDSLKFRVLRNGVSISVPQVPTLAVSSGGPQTREATISTTFIFTATATALATHEATVATTFAFTATATAVIPAVFQATIATTFAFTTTSTAVTTLPATASGPFTFTTTAVATPLHPATIASTFAFTATSAAGVTQQAAIATTFAFTTTSTAGVTQQSSIATTFAFTTTAAATVVVVVPATVATTFAFTTTAAATTTLPATASGPYTFTAIATATPVHPASVATTFAFTTTAAAGVTQQASIATTFAFTATSTALDVRSANIASTFAWTATADASVVALVPATIATTFPFTATSTAALVQAASIATTYTFATTATALATHEATVATAFAFSATATAAPSRAATISTLFGFSAVATADASHLATIATQFTFATTASAVAVHENTIATLFPFTATATAVDTRPATIAATYQWTATAAATVIPPVSATITTAFTFTAATTAVATHPATIATTYPFTATATAAAFGAGSATIITLFDFVTTASATTNRAASISTAFSFTTTSAATTTRAATAASSFTFSATATAVDTRPATIASTYTFVATANALATHPATIATTFTFSATATASSFAAGVASITTQFTFTATATSIPLRAASIATSFTFTTTSTATTTHPALATAVFTFTAIASAEFTTTVTVLNMATALFLGVVAASAAYVGAIKVWPKTYHYVQYLASDTFVLTQQTTIEYLIVAAGGGGATGYGGTQGAGGGAGGIRQGSLSVPAGSYPVVVGLGGLGNPGNVGGDISANGGNSSIFGITAIGGGGGKNWGAGGKSGSGGSGAGGTYWEPLSGSGAGLGIVGQGHDGGEGFNSPNTGGGGGGFAAVGQYGPNGGNGGAGLTINFRGFEEQFAGGGGGAPVGVATHGGGNSGNPPANAVPNKGGGGGGAVSAFGVPGGNGGSGIILLKIPD